jgi:hypothetical protein
MPPAGLRHSGFVNTGLDSGRTLAAQQSPDSPVSCPATTLIPLGNAESNPRFVRCIFLRDCDPATQLGVRIVASPLRCHDGQNSDLSEMCFDRSATIKLISRSILRDSHQRWIKLAALHWSVYFRSISLRTSFTIPSIARSYPSNTIPLDKPTGVMDLEGSFIAARPDCSQFLKRSI